MSRPIPDHPMLQGLWKPWPMEGNVRDLQVVGEIPRELRGTFYRNGPNPQFAPSGEYHFFGGDGMIHAFEFEDGQCHYQNRWVRTPAFDLEREAGEKLFGGFAGSSPPDPRTEGVPGGPANTNVIWHGGKLLALVEGGLSPVDLDPDTLETRGVWNFDGGIANPLDPNSDLPFTAHPKIDPETGEMLAFGYNAIAPYMTYYVIAADGSFVRSEPIDVPFPSMVHDFITTREHVIFPIFPATLRVERMARGESVIGWEPDLGTRIGVMPRDGGNADVVWFQTDPCFVFHPMNAQTIGRTIVAEVARYNTVPLVVDTNPVDSPAHMVRWTIDLDGGTVKQEDLDDRSAEFPRIDARRTGLSYRYGFAAGSSDGQGADHILPMNSIVRYDLQTGARDALDLGRNGVTGEPIFVPRSDSAPEGDGFVLAIVYRPQEDRSDVLVLDAQNVGAEPLATIQLPHRVPGGFHGNWRPAA